MSNEVSAILCSLISGVVSWLVAKHTAKAEIEKLNATWAHEKDAAFEENFESMVAAVNFFIKYGDIQTFRVASEKVAIVRAQSYSPLAYEVDKLNDCLSLKNTNFAKIQDALSAVIETKRITNRH